MENELSECSQLYKMLSASNNKVSDTAIKNKQKRHNAHRWSLVVDYVKHVHSNSFTSTVFDWVVFNRMEDAYLHLLPMFKSHS